MNLTDNEIIKALECCRDNNCNECPIEGCTDNIFRDALDLINRQKAEIERLEKEKDSKLVMCIANDKEKIKSEAIKEFAENLKEISDNFVCGEDFVYVSEIDNLVKEMTEV